LHYFIDNGDAFTLSHKAKRAYQAVIHLPWILNLSLR